MKFLTMLTDVVENGEEVVEETKTLAETLNGNEGVLLAVLAGIVLIGVIAYIFKGRKKRR